MNPNFLNRFMKKLTRERVVPIISARVAQTFPLLVGLLEESVMTFQKREE
jgi:hypothetical protein